jgi:hypothetical protein
MSGKKKVSLAVIVVVLALLALSAPVAQADGGRSNYRWDGVWVYVGLEWHRLGSFGCWSIDGNPFGYIEHWRYHGGWSWDEEWGGRWVPVYGWFQGYWYPDQNAPRDYVGPAQVTYTYDHYKCWSD